MHFLTPCCVPVRAQKQYNSTYHGIYVQNANGTTQLGSDGLPTFNALGLDAMSYIDRSLLMFIQALQASFLSMVAWGTL